MTAPSGWLIRAAARALSERSFELIAAPAIADFQFDAAGAGASSRLRLSLPVLVAIAAAFYEDARRADIAWTVAALTFLPACYYSFLLMLCAPGTVDALSPAEGLFVAAFFVALSAPLVLICAWPERGSTSAGIEPR